MRMLVNFLIMLALPFVLSEDKTPTQTPPSQRLPELRPDTSQVIKKADFAIHDNLDQELVSANIILPTINRRPQ